MGEKIQEAVKLVLKKENLINCKITNRGQTGNEDGYLGNISFLTITGSQDGENKTLDLVIKTSKESKALRQQTPIKELFLREIFIYTRALKAFDELQQEMGLQGLLDFLPHCYATKISDDSELLVLENLNTMGYTTWDRMLPMTHKHVKLVLEAYGQWHAFSFALRRRRRTVFEELIKDNVNMVSEFFLQTNLIGLLHQVYEESRDACLAQNEKDMLSKLIISEKDAFHIFTDLFFEDAEDRVISHGDCWSNNFMFRYQEDPKEPENLFILDWQFSGLSSPVMDLSHFIYACCNTAIHTDVSELLRLYYNSLRKSLELLGLDSEEIFPYAKLVQHWKKFSKYGLLLQGLVLKVAMCDAEVAPDFEVAAEEGKHFLENFDVEISHKEEYYRRIRANLVHYVKNLDIV